MSGNGTEEGADTPTRGGSLLDRRSYLLAAGTAAASIPLLVGEAGAVTERRGIRFRNVVNMVADAGCDPTGKQPCDDQLRAAADDYTLLKFPEGEYYFEEKNVILNKTNLGLIGTGDVRFSVPENYNETLILVDGGTGLLFENIDVDLRADGATPGLHLGVDDDLEIHDVEFIGQGVHPDSAARGKGGNPSVTNCLVPLVRSPSGTGRVRNFVARNAGVMGAYNHGNGRVGVWIGISTKGTITLENCTVEGFPNNGLYCSRTDGVVRVENGLFRNNDVTQVRIGSKGSYVRNATLVADLDNSRSPNPGDALNTRGVRLESGGPGQTRGGTVEGCDITIASTPNSAGGVVGSRTHGDFRVKNTRIRVDVDRVRGIYGKVPDGGPYNVPEGSHAATVHGVSVTGDAEGAEAIGIVNRNGTDIRNCCLQQGGSNRDGVRLSDMDRCSLEGSTLNVAGQPMVFQNARVSNDGNVTGGTCPVPERPGSGGSGGSSGGTNSDGGSNTGPGTADEPAKHTFSIRGGTTDTVVSYRFSASGSLEKASVMGASIDDEDSISGGTATGATAGGTDSYAFTGRIAEFEADGDVTTYIDGDPIEDPTSFLPYTLSIQGGTTDTVVSYRFSASGPVRKDTAMGASIDDEDSISNGEVTGATAGGTDSYAFGGAITEFEADGDVTVYRNGTQVDPGSLEPDTITIEGGHTHKVVKYGFSTTGTLEKDGAMGASIGNDDSVSGTDVTGALAGGRDSYAFTGDVRDFEAEAPVTVYINGEEAAPEEYLSDVLSVSGGKTETTVSYSLKVSGYVAKTDATGASISDEDRAAGKHATGAVAGGTDSYAFSGKVTAFDADGDVTLTHNGNEIDPSQY